MHKFLQIVCFSIKFKTIWQSSKNLKSHFWQNNANIVAGKVVFQNKYCNWVIYYSVAMEGWIRRDTQCHAQCTYTSRTLLPEQLMKSTYFKEFGIYPIDMII